MKVGIDFRDLITSRDSLARGKWMMHSNVKFQTAFLYKRFFANITGEPPVVFMDPLVFF